LVRSRQRFAPEQGRVARNVLFECAAKPATSHPVFPPASLKFRRTSACASVLTPRVTETNLETDMKTIVLVLSLIALAAPAQAAQKTQSRHDSQSLEQKCRQMVGKEQYEGEGRGHIGQMQAQRFSDCMIGMPN
jgi:hypothetical protein